MGAAAQTAYRLGQETSGSATVAAGLKGVRDAAGGALKSKADGALGLSEAAASGQQAAWSALNDRPRGGSGGAGAAGATPAWAEALQRRQDGRHHRQVALHALREGDRGGASASPDIQEKED